MAFDEFALESEESVSARDPSRLLFALATAGAQVRAGIAAAAGGERLGTGDPPRAVLVAVDRLAAPGPELLAGLGGQVVPVLPWQQPVLPRWASAADALLVACRDGRHPRLAALVEQAARRGMIVAVVAPADSPVAAAGRAVVRDVAPGHPRASRWSLLAPLLQTAVELGVVDPAAAPWDAVADALDATAAACRPGGDPYTNAAKQLAADLAEARPVIAGAGQLATVAAHTMVTSLALLACTAASTVALPEEIATAGALLSAPREDAGDFFRDRSEDEPIRPRLVIVGDDPADSDQGGDDSHRADGPLGDLAGSRAARALREIATRAGVRYSDVDVPDGTALERFAAATAFGDFTAAYLGIGLGRDPGEPRPGEMAH